MQLNYRIQLLFGFLFLVIIGLPAQNLLPDGSFEEVLYVECERPDQGFKKMRYWYLLDATPDLFEGNCRFNENEFNFWDEEVRPYDGKNYAGIWSRWNSNNNYVSEGIATSLNEPLKAGQTYLFQMAILNQGEFAGVLAGNQTPCSLTPDKHIDLYLSRDSITIENDFSTGSSSTSAGLVAILSSSDIIGGSGDAWTIISTCFQAQGGEQHLGVIMPLGTFGPLPACATDDIEEGVYQSFYFNLDAISVTELNESGERDLAFCADQSFEIDLPNLFPDPLFKEAIFLWDDGGEANKRTLLEKRTYEVLAQLECGDFPLTVNVIAEDCGSGIYIPNAFSPNNDGVNDEFKVFFVNPENVQNFQLRIYDRWGTVVFDTINKEDVWNGSSRSQTVGSGTFFYELFYEKEELGELISVKERGELLILK